MFDVEAGKLEKGVPVMDLLVEEAEVFPSKGELRRLIKGGGVSINKAKIQNHEHTISAEDLLNNKYLLVQKGKKNYFLIRTV